MNTEQTNTVLEARISSNADNIVYRARLITSPERAPVLAIDQQFHTGEWGPTGGRWFLFSLYRDGNTADSISIDAGQNWGIDKGMKQAINEALKIVLKTHRHTEV